MSNHNTETMKNDTNVLAHIQKRNAETLERVASENLSFYMLIAEEIAPNYDTVYDFELSQAREYYSEVYKEERGFRPRISTDLSLEEVETLIENLEG